MQAVNRNLEAKDVSKLMAEISSLLDGTPARLDGSLFHLLQNALMNDKKMTFFFNTLFTTGEEKTPQRRWELLRDLDLSLRILASHSSETRERQALREVATKIHKIWSADQPEVFPPWTSQLEKMDKIVRNSTSPSAPKTPGLSLLSKPIAPIDEKVYTHIHLEALLENSDKEGAPSLLLLKYLSSYLQGNAERYKDMAGFSHVNAMLQKATSFAEKVEAEQSASSMPAKSASLEELLPTLDTFTEGVRAEVGALRPGERTLFPSGWTGTPGHAMLMAVARQDDGKLTIRLYNSGAGLSHHASLSMDGELLYQPFLDIQDVDIERFTAQPFLQALFEMYFVKYDLLNKTPTNYSDKELYDLFLCGLDGKVVTCALKGELFMKPQVSGTCSWSSLTAFLHSNLPQNEYRRLLYDIQLDSLCAAFRSAREEIEKNEESLFLLQQGAILFAQSALDAYAAKIISPEEFSQAHATLLELTDALTVAQRKLAHRQASSTALSLEGIERAPIVRNEIKGLQIQKMEELKTDEYRAGVSEKESDFDFQQIERPETLLSGIKQFRSYLDQKIQSNPYNQSQLQLSYKKFLLHLPPPGAFWNRIPENEIPEVMTGLADAMEFIPIFEDMDRRKYEAFNLSVLAILHSLAKRCPGIADRVMGWNLGSFFTYIGSKIGSPWHGGASGDQNLYGPKERIAEHEALDYLQHLDDGKKGKLFPIADYNDFKIFQNLAGYNFPMLKESNIIEVRWAASLIENDPSVVEKIMKKFPELNENNLAAMTIHALTDMRGEIFPPAWCALKRQALYAKLFFLGYEVYTPLEPVSCSVEGEEKTLNLALNVKEKNPGSYLDFNGFEKDSPLVALIKMARDCPAKKNTLMNHEAAILASKFMEHPLYKEGELSSQDIKELLLLLTHCDFQKGDPHREFQVVKTLAYFCDNVNINKLKEAEMCAFVQFLLFEDHFLEKILAKNPEFGRKLADFVEKGWQHFYSHDLLAPALFFLRLGRDLNNVVNYNRKEKIPFLDDRALITKALQSEAFTEKQCYLLYAELAASYTNPIQETLTTEEATLLFTAFTFINAYDALIQNFEIVVPNGVVLKANQAKDLYRENIADALETEATRDALCNSALRAVNPLEAARRWKKINRYVYASADGAVHLDLSCDYMISAAECRKRPIMAKMLAPFRKIPGLLKKENYICQVSDAIYEFADERGTLTWISKDFDTRGKLTYLCYQRHEGAWYRLMPREEAAHYPGLSPYISALSRGSLWVPVEFSAAPKILLKDASMKTLQTISLQLPEEARQSMEEDCRANTPEETKAIIEWHCKCKEDFDLAAKHKLLLLTPSTQLTSFLQCRKQENNAKMTPEEELLVEKFLFTTFPTEDRRNAIQTILRRRIATQQPLHIKEREDAAPGSQKLLLADLNGCEVGEKLKSIFGETVVRNALLWKSTTGTPTLLELPSSGLSFDLTQEAGTWRASCREYPGTILSDNQCIRGLSSWKGGVVIENKTGDRSALIPRGSIKVQKTGAFCKAISIEQKEENRGETILFPLNKRSEPVATHREQQLYLAYLLLGQKQYEHAAQLLHASSSHVLPYNAADTALLDKIIVLPDEMRDPSPHGAALALMALLCRTQHPKALALDKEFFPWDKIKQLYLTYKANKELAPHLLLPEEMVADIERLLSQNIRETSNSKTRAEIDLSIPRYGEMIKPAECLPTDEKKFIEVCQQFINLQKGISEAEEETAAIRIPMVTKPPQKLLTHYLQLYNTAKKFPKSFDIAQLFEKKSFAPLWEGLLQAIRELPDNFPDVKEFKNILSQKDWNNFNKLILAPYTDWRNSYLNKLSREEKITPQQPPNTLASGVIKPKRYRRPTEAIDPTPRHRPVDEVDGLVPGRAPILKERSQLTAAFFSTPTQAIQLTGDEIEQLQAAVRGTGGVQVLPGVSGKLADDVAAYWDDPARQASWHMITPEKLGEVGTLLRVEHAEANKRYQIDMQQLLQDINTLPELERIALQLEQMGKMRQDITKDDLLLFVARRQHLTLAGKNPALHTTEDKFYLRALLLFDRLAQIQQVGRSIKIVEKLEERLTKIPKSLPEKDPLYCRLAEALYTEISRKLPKDYDILRHPEYLVFELLSDVGLYPGQVADLQRLLHPRTGENSQVILQKLMGGGKTKVYLPLLALNLADGDNLACVVVHSSQYESTAKNMEIQTGQIFHQAAHPLHFSRELDFSLPKLCAILDTLESVRGRRDFLIVTDKTIHELGLCYLETAKNYLDSGCKNGELKDKTLLLEKIFDILTIKGKAIFDEADLLLNCRQEVIHSIGTPAPAAQEHCNIVADLYQSISKNPSVQQAICSTPTAEKADPLTLQLYHEKLKVPLMTKFLDDMLDTTEMTTLKTVLQGIPNVDKKLLLAFIKQEEVGKEYVKTLPPKARDIMAILEEEFTSLLPTTLQKIYCQNYGPAPNKLLPVPYLASNVPSPAEFNYLYTLLGLTVQMVQNEGVSPEQLLSLVKHMQESAAAAEDSKKASVKIPAYQDFLDLNHDVITTPFYKVGLEDCKLLASYYKEHPDLLDAFMRRHLFSQIKMYPSHLTSTLYTLARFFKNIIGFSGTPYNSMTYPDKLETILEVGADGRTMGIMWSKSRENIRYGKREDFPGTIADIVEAQKKGGGCYNGFINTGALFTGISNVAVGEALLAALDLPIKGVVVYKDNLPVVLERGNPVPLPYDKSTLKPEELYIYYDEWHTTGSDFRLPADAKLLQSVGKATRSRDLFQGYWRAREVDKGQQVEFFLPDKVERYLREELKVPTGQPVGLPEILRSSEINQERELLELMNMAILGKIREVKDRYVNQFLKNSKMEGAVLKPVQTSLNKLIADEARDTPYDERFGEGSDSTESRIKKIIDDIVVQFLPIIATGILPDLTAEGLRDELNRSIDAKSLTSLQGKLSLRNPNQLAECQTITETQSQTLNLAHKEMAGEVSRNSCRFSTPLPWNWSTAGSDRLSDKGYYPLQPVDEIMKLSNEELPHTQETRVKLGFGLYSWTQELPFSDRQVPIFEISSAMGKERLWDEYKGIFSLEASYNFMPLQANAKPFDPEEPAVQRLLILSERTPPFQKRIILLSQADAAFFMEALANERNRGGGGQQLDVALYDLSLDVIQSNNNTQIKDPSFLKDPEIAGKIVEAKFYGGALRYEDDELELLRSWIEKNGAERMEKLFYQEILKNKEKIRREYENSPIHHLFSQCLSKK